MLLAVNGNIKRGSFRLALMKPCLGERFREIHAEVFPVLIIMSTPELNEEAVFVDFNCVVNVVLFEEGDADKLDVSEIVHD